MSEMQYDPKQIRILIADDHDLIRKSIEKVLRAKDFQHFIGCSNGVEAINILKTTNIDLIFCDIYMPKADGFQVLQFLRNRTTNHDIPFIIVTGEAGKDDIVKTVDMGAEDYLLKPFQSQELERKTHQILTKYFKPNASLFHIRLAERCLLEGELDKAEKCIKTALENSPKSGRAAHAKAMIQEAQGETAAAIETLRESIQRNPSFLKNYITLADIHLKLNNKQEAIKNIKKELELNPKNVKRQVQLARLLHTIGDFAGAIEHYRLALVEKPKNKNALFGMGIAHAEINNLEKAFYYFKRMRRQYPDLSKPLEAMVKYAMDAQTPKLADLALRDEKKSHPKRMDTYIVLAKFYLANDKSEEALEVCTEGATRDPENLSILKLKGAIEIKVNELSAAETTFRQIADIAPGAASWLRIVDVLAEQEKYSECLELLHKCLYQKKVRGKVLAKIGALEAKTGQITKSYFSYLAAQKNGQAGEKTIHATRTLKKHILARREPKTGRTAS